jgi:hypothetical protein
VALPPLAVSFVLAVRVFRAAGAGTGWRTTIWASALFLAGILIIGVTTAIRDNH